MRFANWLRRLAQVLDPQPHTFELMQTAEPIIEDLNDLRGLPVYFWKTDERSVSFYPIPDEPLRLCVRR